MSFVPYWDETNVLVRFIHLIAKLFRASDGKRLVEKVIMSNAMKSLLAIATALLLSAGSAAQLGLPAPQVPHVKLPVDLPDTGPLSAGKLGEMLAAVRIHRLTQFVRGNRKSIEWDGDKNPAVRGELLAMGVDDTAIAAAQAQGFKLLSREAIEGLDLSYARFGTPKGMDLKEALSALRKLLPDTEIDANHIYFQSGEGVPPLAASAAVADTTVSGASLGLVDGGVADHPSVKGRVEQAGFAIGAPKASSHGTSVAALMIGSGTVTGARPGASLLAADVYGTASTDGNAATIAKALAWLATRKVSVVTISLVGPNNALLKNAIQSAQGKGMLIVAAVGNDGPAAPPAYPASYRGVIAVTGVDAKNRPLPEAGKAGHIDFAAPGADISSALGVGKTGKVRGTSFAAPLVAARLAAHYPRQSIPSIDAAIAKLIGEAQDLGKSGFDTVYGYGLICGRCGQK